MNSYGHWNIGIVGDFNPGDFFGFVYLIENTLTHQKYIGRKQLQSKTRKKVAGRKNRKVVYKDSDWRSYVSSSEELGELILANIHQFTFTILKLCKTKRELGYSEVEEQFKREVLTKTLPDGKREYYNRNIMSRWFVQSDNLTEEHKQKIRDSKLGHEGYWKGKKRPEQSEWMQENNPSKQPEVAAKISQSRLGDKNPAKREDVRRKISEAKQGKKWSLERKLAHENRRSS